MECFNCGRENENGDWFNDCEKCGLSIGIIERGAREERIKKHNELVEEEFERARNGAVIDITRLMASKEKLVEGVV